MKGEAQRHKPPKQTSRYSEAGELEARAASLMHTAATITGEALRLYAEAAAIRNGELLAAALKE